ncbi:hypothetical protein OE88DRAFT_1740139 [Heliocybe sulcata]|uniref:DUF7330 domain-containing protein n=1 Tax=Heliocybe sulcata TaxID=5364 RepID=A0A5C3ML83_9AGAM|nr:hypothetical protein OE88DRAFT_1740139 [Heliocybe sulcata]
MTILEDQDIQGNPSAPPSYSNLPDVPEDIRHVKPTNYLYIVRSFGLIDDTYVIDPTYEPTIPSYMLPKVKEGQKRKNLCLCSTFGSVKADVWIRAGSARGMSAEKHEKRRTSIKASSDCRPVTVKHAESGNPFHLVCDSAASVVVYLPRTFSGLLVTGTDLGSVRYSPEVSARLTVLSEINGIRYRFLGDYESSNWDKDAEHWEGDEVRLHTGMGTIRVAFLDEEWPTIRRSSWFFRCILLTATSLLAIWVVAIVS